jgi:hypothetical protein
MSPLLRLAVASLLLTPVPAPAMNLDAEDAYFESCVFEYVNRRMGNPDQAAAYCYEKAYGSEQSPLPSIKPPSKWIPIQSCPGFTVPRCDPPFVQPK